MFSKFSKKIKILSISSVILILAYIVVSFSLSIKVKEDIKFWVDDNINYRLDIITNALKKSKSHNNRYYNDYNEEFLPKTQNNDLNFEKKKFNFIRSLQLKFLKKNPDGNNLLSFFIETLESNKLLIIDSRSNIFLINNFNSQSTFEMEDVKLIENDIKNDVDRVLDSFLYNNKLFISFESREKNKCKKFKIFVAELDEKFMSFDTFFVDNSCKSILNSGRMLNFKFDKEQGLLFAVSAARYDYPTKEPQDESSNFGKILFKSFNTKKIKVFSKGHRLILGLCIESKNGNILSTENGPRGGDEINKIVFNGNYGWPTASYGRRYDSKLKDDPVSYKNSHEDYNFEEPIFSFIPSIGISEVIEIPNNFTKNWIDNFLIASLNKRSLFRVKFDSRFDRLLFYEEIYIGSRIRDMKFHKKTNSVLVALEDRAELGILSEN